MADVEEKRAIEANDKTVKESSSFGPGPETHAVHADGAPVEEQRKKAWYMRVLEPGNVFQIIIAAVLALAIGLGVSAGVGVDNIPPAAPAILAIPGTLWLRCLQTVGKSTPGEKFATQCSRG